MIINMNVFKKEKTIKNFLLNYYKDLQDDYIPYFLQAESMYKQLIKTDKDLDYYYNMIKSRKGNYA